VYAHTQDLFYGYYTVSFHWPTSPLCMLCVCVLRHAYVCLVILVIIILFLIIILHFLAANGHSVFPVFCVILRGKHEFL